MGTNNPSPGTLANLLDDFADRTIRDSLGPSLALITPGHWGRFIRWGAAHGYVFTADDIRVEFGNRPGLLRAFAQSSWLQAWNLESLSAFADRAMA
jgi:hypothetical protein